MVIKKTKNKNIVIIENDVKYKNYKKLPKKISNNYEEVKGMKSSENMMKNQKSQ